MSDRLSTKRARQIPSAGVHSLDLLAMNILCQLADVFLRPVCDGVIALPS